MDKIIVTFIVLVTFSLTLAQISNKTGTCPAIQPGNDTICNGTICVDDSGCPGDLKCCNSTCASLVCTAPVRNTTCPLLCPAGFRCELRGLNCRPPAHTGLLPTCVSEADDNCGRCRLGEICISTNGKCPLPGACRRFECTVNDTCGGCPEAAVCEAALRVCVISPYLNPACSVLPLRRPLNCPRVPPSCRTDMNCRAVSGKCCPDNCGNLLCVRRPPPFRPFPG